MPSEVQSLAGLYLHDPLCKIRCLLRLKGVPCTVNLAQTDHRPGCSHTGAQMRKSSLQLPLDSERDKWDHLMAPYKTSGCPGTSSPPSHRRLQREAKHSQKAAEQFRHLPVFFYFNWMQCPHLCLPALFSHMTNIHGPLSSLILKTIAPKKPPCSYMLSNITDLSPDHWDCILRSQGRHYPASCTFRAQYFIPG